MSDSKPECAVFLINSLQNGGAERVVANQCAELSRRGMSVYLIAVYDLRYYALPDDVSYTTLSRRRSKVSKLLSLPALAAKLDAELRKIEEQNRIVLLSAHLPYAHWAARWSRNRNRFLYVMHNPQFHFPHSRSQAFRWKLRFLYAGRKLVAVSDGVRKELIDIYGLNERDIARIYNPLDFQSIDDMLKRHSAYPIPQEKYLLFVGRLTSQKNIPRLLKAYKLSGLAEGYPLVMLGSGELENETRKLIAGLGLEGRVFMPGWEKNAYPWMKSASLLVSSSDYESFGMSLAEALYCGCPVASTNCRYGPAEILTGNFASFLSDLDAASLAEKMRLALSDFPADGKRLTEKFDVSMIMNQYLAQYGAWFP